MSSPVDFSSTDGGQDCLVRRRSRRGVDVDVVEVVKVLQPLPRPAHRLGVERVAFGQAELSANHLVLGARVADDIDPLDIDARAFADIEDQVHDVLSGVADNPRLHLDESIAAIVHIQLHRIDAASDRVAIIPIALVDLQIVPQSVAVQVAQLRVDGDLADPVAITLADREGEEETGAIGRQLGFRVLHLEIDVAVLQIEPAQQLLVEIQPLRIIFVGRGQKPPPALLAAVDHLGQPVLAERMVADKGDLADQRHAAVVDLIDHIDTVLTEPDDLRIDPRIVVAALGIQIEDVLAVLLGQRRREHGSRLELHLRRS